MNLSKSLLLLLLPTLALAQKPAPDEAESVYADAHSLYVEVHEHPELSSQETQTAAKLAAKLRNAGYEVAEHVGGTGVVAILKTARGQPSCSAPNWMPCQ